MGSACAGEPKNRVRFGFGRCLVPLVRFGYGNRHRQRADRSPHRSESQVSLNRLFINPSGDINPFFFQE